MRKIFLGLLALASYSVFAAKNDVSSAKFGIVQFIVGSESPYDLESRCEQIKDFFKLTTGTDFKASLSNPVSLGDSTHLGTCTMELVQY